MAEQGWISIHRKIRECFLYNDKPFDRTHAWLDMLLSANHQDKKVPIGNQLILVERGSFVTSIRGLCDKWGWSNTKVVAFMNMLQSDGMIHYKSDTKKTVVTIDNYDFYQSSNDTETIQKHYEPITETTQKHTNNNDNNANKEYIVQSEKIWSIYPEKKGKAKAIVKIPTLIKKHGYEQMERTVKRYIDYVNQRRNTDFKDLKYQNGSTFFNGTYIDYLDENFNTQVKEQKSNVTAFNFNGLMGG